MNLQNCAFIDFLNKFFGILEQMYLFIGMCNDKVGIFPRYLCCITCVCLSTDHVSSN